MSAIPMAQDRTFPIAGRYRPLLDRPLAEAGSPLAAFAAADREDPSASLMAVECRRDLPPRAAVLDADLADVPGLLRPLAHGAAPAAAGESWFVICPAPPGGSLAAAGPIPETALMGTVLPALARPLIALAARGFTHRAIRPGNIFRGAAGIVLGEAWAAPAGAFQPAALEPPYLGMCRPEARGAATPADDVFALGATLLALAHGRLPLDGVPEEEIVRRQIERGSFAALTDGARLSSAFAELLRALLADDPSLRPHAHNLISAAQGRLPRPTPRPMRRASTPLAIGGLVSRDMRSLAHAVATRPTDAAALIRGGDLPMWLRRNLGENGVAAAVDEITRLAGDDGTLIARTVAALDPLAPLCWRGIALWPDGIGPAIARARAASSPDLEPLREMIAQEGLTAWSDQRCDSETAMTHRREARGLAAMLRNPGPTGGLDRIAYHLNPLLPAEGAALAGTIVTDIDTLLPALEAAAQRPDLRQGSPIDRALLPFLAAHLPGGAEREAADLVNTAQPHLAPLAQLRLLARLETKLLGPATPHLAAWLAEGAAASPTGIASRSRRKRFAERLTELAPEGRIAPMLVLLESPDELSADRAEARAATAERNAILARIAALDDDRDHRPVAARRIGREAAAACGLLVTVFLAVRSLL